MTQHGISLREQKIREELDRTNRLYSQLGSEFEKLAEQYDKLQENYYKICALKVEQIMNLPEVKKFIKK